MDEQRALALFEVAEEDGLVLGRATSLDMAYSWREAFEYWLESRGSVATRKAYRDAWRIFLAFTGKMPWEITKADVQRWVDAMRQQMPRLADATIQQRVAALCSLYNFCQDEYEITLADGRRMPLCERNPARAKSLRAPRKKEDDEPESENEQMVLDGRQAAALLKAIPLNTVQGLRDFALFLMFLATGRRNSEIRTLRKGDFRERGGIVQYYWSQKRKGGWDEVPTDVLESIQAYLKAAGREWESLDKTAYIFTALTTSARRLRNVGEGWNPHAQALSLREINRLIKKYARLAGILDWKKVHVHTLRHTVAFLMDDMKMPIREIQDRLKHSSLDMTNHYIGKMRGDKNIYWEKARVMYEMPENPMAKTKK